MLATSNVWDTADMWKDVSWSNDAKSETFLHYMQTHLWSETNNKHHLEFINPTVTHGGGNIMMWGCFGWQGKSEDWRS